MITVGYGTNDWHSSETVLDRFLERSGEFFEKLVRLYPGVPVYAIAPIWRGDIDTRTKIGIPLCQIKDNLVYAAKDYPDVKIIDAIPFVPHLKEFYADEYLHPNDLGFCEYADRLYKAISESLIITD